MGQFQKGQHKHVYVSVEKDQEYEPDSKVCGKEFSNQDAVTTTISWKCFLGLVSLIVATFLLVYLSVHFNKSGAEMDTQNSKTESNTNTPTTLKSPENVIYRHGNETWDHIKSMKQGKPLDVHNETEYASNGRVTKVLTVTNGGPYGIWFQPQFCPFGTFAVGFNMKYQNSERADIDDTGLNAVSLQCASMNGTREKGHRPVQSAAAQWGQWTADVFCPEGKYAPLFLQKFALRVQTEKLSGDDTMANVIRFSCRDLYRTEHPHKLVSSVAGVEGEYGQWSKACPKGSAICGIQTRIEGYLQKGDNTALNDIRFFCCDSRYDEESVL